MECQIENKNVVPFLRWTGSKRWFTKSHIEDFLPKNFGDYHEPFLGAGSVFFHLTNKVMPEKKFFLSDSNEELTNAYLQIRDNPEVLIIKLREFNNTKEDYYIIRGESYDSPLERAARFIFLNRTSFNGIYRVNSNGLYNVPYGNRAKVDFVTERLLLDVSKRLKNVEINAHGFEKCIHNIKKGDLVFLDPPYTVAHENNGFIEYNQHLFAWEDQERLRDLIIDLIDLGAYFLLTNASHTSIAELYRNIGKMTKLSRNSQVGGRNKTRRMYNELVITNIRS
jgi:DNA adenine methylase